MPKAIETKYFGSGATTPSRMVAKDSDNNKVVISSSGGREEDHRAAAEALRDKMGWSGQLIGGGTRDGYAWVFLPEPLYLLRVIGDIEPEVLGPFNTSEERFEEAKRLKEENGDDDGLFPFTGEIEISVYSGGDFMDADSPTDMQEHFDQAIQHGINA